jgi:hypothetical protein
MMHVSRYTQAWAAEDLFLVPFYVNAENWSTQMETTDLQCDT